MPKVWVVADTPGQVGAKMGPGGWLRLRLCCFIFCESATLPRTLKSNLIAFFAFAVQISAYKTCLYSLWTGASARFRYSMPFSRLLFTEYRAADMHAKLSVQSSLVFSLISGVVGSMFGALAAIMMGGGWFWGLKQLRRTDFTRHPSSRAIDFTTSSNSTLPLSGN